MSDDENENADSFQLTPLMTSDDGTSIEDYDTKPLVCLQRFDEIVKHSYIPARQIQRWVRRSKICEMQETLANNQNVGRMADDAGITALEYAARYGRLDVIDLLLEHKIDWNPEDGLNLLQMIARYCTKQVVEKGTPDENSTAEEKIVSLIDKLFTLGADANYANPGTNMPIFYAAMWNNAVTVDALIRHGAKINHHCDLNLSPIFTACVYGAHDVLNVLLQHKADIRTVDKAGNNVYHIAALKGNAETFQLLINYENRDHDLDGLLPIDLHLENKELKTPLMFAVYGNHPAITQIILKHSPIVNCIRSERWLLHWAASKGYLDVVKILVEAGFDILLMKDVKDQKHFVPIHEAAKNDHPQVIEYLIKTEPKCLEKHTESGLTPLLLAAQHDSLGAVKVLLEHEADIEALDDMSKSIILLAAYNQSSKVLSFILNYLHQTMASRKFHHLVNQPDINHQTAIQAASKHGCTNAVRLLYEAGAHLDSKNELGWNTLHIAANYKKTNVARLLLEYNKLLVLHRDNRGNTPLHLAASNGDDDTLKLLLKAKSDIKAINEDGETPLYRAVAGGNFSTTKILLDKGAARDSEKENSNKLCLHYAAEHGYDKIVEIILERIPVDIRDHRNRTALDLAIEKEQRAVVETLLRHENWELLMISKQTLPLGRHPHSRDTPFRRLIASFPDSALQVLDRCSFVVHKDTMDEELGLKDQEERHHVYEWIDDTYMMVKSRELSGDESPYFDPKEEPDKDYKLRPEAVEYNQDYDIICDNHPLQLMVNYERTKLLFHPVTQSLINQKWKKLGRYVFGFGFAIYLLFLMLYTTYVTQVMAPYENRLQLVIDLLTNSSQKAEKEACSPNHQRPSYLSSIKYSIIILALFQIMKEALQLYHRRWAYFTLDNLIECFVYFGSIYTVLDIEDCAHVNALRTDWQWTIMSLCAFAAWINLIQLIRQLPDFGIYVVMFLDVLTTFIKSCFILVLFVIAFSSAFFVLMKNREEFSSLPLSLLKTTAMMIGEFEFTSIFHGSQMDHAEKLFKYEFTSLMFVAFCVIMTIILINLLIGLAVDDIKLVREKAHFKRISLQVYLVLQVEAPLPWLRKMMARSRRIIKKCDENKEEEEALECLDKEIGLYHRLDFIDEQNEIMSNRLSNIENALKSIKQSSNPVNTPEFKKEEQYELRYKADLC